MHYSIGAYSTDRSNKWLWFVVSVDMRSRLLSLFALAVVPAMALSADKETEELLTKMRKAYSSTRSARIFAQATVPSDVGELDIQIETTYIRPDKIHAVIKTPAEFGGMTMTLKTDGKKILLSGGPGGKEVRPFDLENVVNNVPVNLETMNFWDWKRQLSTKEGGNMKTSKFKIIKKETWKNKDWLVLEETAPAQGVFVRYFIDPETSLIHRTRMQRIKGSELIMDVKITKLELNVSIDASIFKIEDKPLSPPKPPKSGGTGGGGTAMPTKGGGRRS
jgi:outer membrane lipoprotein-sorting protein